MRGLASDCSATERISSSGTVTPTQLSKREGGGAEKWGNGLEGSERGRVNSGRLQWSECDGQQELGSG
jgi:hypothetical protein